MRASRLVAGVSLAVLMVLPAAALAGPAAKAPAAAAVTAGSFQEDAAEALIGEWEMVTQFQGQEIPATMVVSLEDDGYVGVWRSMGEEMPMTNIKVEGNKLTFNRTMGVGGAELTFEGTIEGDTITGKWLSDMGGEYVCTGKKKS